MIKIRNYIDGEMIAPQSGRYLDNFNPATGAVYSQIPDSGPQDVDMAVAAALRAFPEWSRRTAEERYKVLMAVSEGITAALDDLAMAESVDNGKPFSLAKSVDIPRAASNFQFFATAILHFSSESHPVGQRFLNYTLRKPIGVAGCISPWNLPLYLFTWKIAPALAAGNCVVAKPSEVTPMTAAMLSEICIKAGLPPGVLNIVHGRGNSAGEAIISHPQVPCISFTGGTATGAHIARSAAPMFKKLSLELGGKNPNIIFADCDYDKMLDTTMRSSFANQGQICLCGSRIFVERPIYDRFKNDFLTRTKALKVGDPLEAGNNLGAVVSEAHMQKILSCIDLAGQEGGTILCGGEQLSIEGRCANGWFVAPTIIEDLDPYCRTNQEEIFGPVVTIMPFDSEAEVVSWANCTPYGLSATLWTSDLNRTHRIADQLQSGIIWVNCWLVRDLRTPFGGMKQSGVGREGGLEALRFLPNRKTSAWILANKFLPQTFMLPPVLQ